MKTLSDAVLMMRETAQELEELDTALKLPAQSMTLQHAYARVLSVAGDKFFEIRFIAGPRSLSADHGPAYWTVYTQSIGENGRTFTGDSLADVVNACIAAHRPAPPIASMIASAESLLVEATDPGF